MCWVFDSNFKKCTGLDLFDSLQSTVVSIDNAMSERSTAWV